MLFTGDNTDLEALNILIGVRRIPYFGLKVPIIL